MWRPAPDPMSACGRERESGWSTRVLRLARQVTIRLGGASPLIGPPACCALARVFLSLRGRVCWCTPARIVLFASHYGNYTTTFLFFLFIAMCGNCSPYQEEMV